MARRCPTSGLAYRRRLCRPPPALPSGHADPPDPGDWQRCHPNL